MSESAGAPPPADRFPYQRLFSWCLPAAVCASLILVPAWCEAHGVEGKDARLIAENTGPALGAYLYLGAKHMVTGIDHLLYLAGVIFFLYRARDVALYVTLFALGHSTTLLAGVLGGIHANADLVDAVIGLSVAYKAFENIGGFRAVGLQPNPKAAVAVFGLFHGFGLATKLQAINLSPDGLVVNMLAFNVGVELGQLIALAVMLAVFTPWRRSGRFEAQALSANWMLMTAGFVLIGFHLTGYLRG